MNTPYLFAPLDPPAESQPPSECLEAVYRIDGYIYKTYRHTKDSDPFGPVWVYIANDGQETGLESTESPDTLRRLILSNQKPD